MALLLPGAGWPEHAAVLCALLWVGWRSSRPMLVVLAAGAFVLVRGAAVDVTDRAVPCGERLLVEARITSIPERSEGGWRFDARVTHPRQAGQQDLAVRIDFPRQGALRPRSGETWQLALGYHAAAPRGVGARVLLRDRIHARARALVSPLNQRLQPAGPSWLSLRERVADGIHGRAQDPAAAALIAALAVGATGEVSDRQWRVFSATGISHLVAISGMHVTFFAMLSMIGARALWRRLSLLQCRLRREVFAAAVGVTLAAGYALLSGFSVPAQRTLVMLLAFVVLRETARAATPCAALGIATVAVLALDPMAVLDAGFWLSFVAVAAIILLPGSRIRIAGTLRGAADVQWAVSLALLPLTLVIFGMFSVVGLAVNIVAIPLFTLLLVPVVLFATLGYLLPGDMAWPLADRLVDLAQLMVRPLWTGLTWAADLPGAVVSAQPGVLVSLVICGALLLVLLPLDPRVRAAAGVLLAWTFVAALPAPGRHQLEIEVLDAGSGSAVLLRTARHALLAGSAESFGSRGRGFISRLQPQLRARLPWGPEAWVIGRTDGDRLAGLAAARARGVAGRAFGIVLAPRSLPPELTSCDLRRWQWDGVDFELQRAVSGRGCLLTVVNRGHRTVLLVDGDEADRARLLAHSDSAPDLLLLPARARGADTVHGYLVQGAGVEVAARIAIDDGRHQVLRPATYWQRLAGARPTQHCAAPDQVAWHRL